MCSDRLTIKSGGSSHKSIDRRLATFFKWEVGSITSDKAKGFLYSEGLSQRDLRNYAGTLWRIDLPLWSFSQHLLIGCLIVLTSIFLISLISPIDRACFLV